MSDCAQEGTRTVAKRPRPVLSCLECRRKKLKCDRLLPCQQCLKLNQPSLCQYAPGQEPEARDSARNVDVSNKRARFDTSVEPSQASSGQIEDLNDRVKRLEEALRQQQVRQPTEANDGRTTTRTSSVADPLARTSEPDDNGEWPQVEEDFSIFRKFEEALDFVESLQHRRFEPQLLTISNQLHSLQRALSTYHNKHESQLASFSSIADLTTRMIDILPAPAVRDKLVALYFENFHHCFRIICKPQFLIQLEQFDGGILAQLEIEYFVPTLLGVLFVASSLNTYPECDLPGLDGRHNGVSAAQLMENWYDIMLWRDGPSISTLQVKVLAMQAGKYQHTEYTRLWSSSGELVRQAMILKLHKKPQTNLSNLEKEIRTCLWLTILEQDLALAMYCAMPPMCPNFELQAPLNIDETILWEGHSTDLQIQPLDQWTDSLCQHILGTSFNQRLAAYKHRFHPKSPSHYLETLKIARSLESVLRDLPPLFRLDHIADNAANTPGRLMAQMELDITLRRSLIATYEPYARAMPLNDIFREARVLWVQSNLIVICYQDLFDPQYPAIDVPQPIGYWDFYYNTYRFEVQQSLEAMLLEAYQIKQLESVADPNVQSASSRAAVNSPVKLMKWGYAGMIKSVEDTLHPLMRRVERPGGSLRDVIRYTMLYKCLQAPSKDVANKYIIDGLQDVAATLQSRIDAEEYSLEPRMRLGLHHVRWLKVFLALDHLFQEPRGDAASRSAGPHVAMQLT